MALSPCNTTVDCNGRELVEHGSSTFPIACYHDDLSKNEVPWHWHEELEAFLVTEGSAVVAAGNEKYIVHSGEGFFINSSILHGAWNFDKTSCRFHSLVFHPRLIGGSLDSVFFQKYVQPLTENTSLESILLSPTISWQANAIAAIESAWQICIQEPFGFEFKVRNALSELILQLQENAPSTPKQLSNKKLRDDERIKQMLQYIHSHFSDELNTKIIADTASISESECLRCFKTTIGTTPIRYVRQYRIQQACEMLISSDIQISDIVHLCGFLDLSYFTKTFREIKGCTPSKYRRQSTKTQ